MVSPEFPLDDVPAAVVVTDPGGVVTGWNREAEAFFGWTRGEAVGHDIMSLTVPADRMPEGKRLMAELRAGKRWQGEFLVRRKDGTSVPVHITLSPKRDEAGRVDGIVGVSIDLSARKQREDERAALLATERAGRSEAEQAEERSRFLDEANSLLSASLDQEETLSRLAHLIVPAMADWCLMYRPQDDGQIHRLAVAHVDPVRSDLVTALQEQVALDPEAQGGVPGVLRTGESILHPDADASMLAEDTVNPDLTTRLTAQLGIRSWMCVPMGVRARTIGAISFVTAESGRRYGPDDLSLAQDLAGRAALAVDNARLYESQREARLSSERAARRRGVLYAVTAALSEALRPEEVAEVVVDRCVEAMGAAAGLLAALSPSADQLEVVRSVGYRDQIIQDYARFPVDAPLPLSDAVRSREPVLIETRRERDERYPHLNRGPMGIESIAAVPLLVERRAIGGMALSFTEARPFSGEDRSFLMALGRQCAQALERSRLYQAERVARSEAERANDRLAFLAQASELLSLSLDYRTTLSEVARLAVPRLADWCSVDMLDEAGGIEQVAATHVDPAKMEMARLLREGFPPRLDDPTGAGHVIQSGQAEIWPLVTPEFLKEVVADPERRRLAMQLTISSSMVVPLRVRWKTLGAITLASTETHRAYTAADLALAEDLARRAAQAVDNAAIYQERDYIARTLQQSLLPPALPEIPGVEIAARYLPAGTGNEVGGDFYDVFDTGEGSWGLAIGDVCGKGPDAAAVMGVARYSLRAAAVREARPSRILEVVNEAVLSQASDGRFLTVAYARLRPEKGTGQLTVCCGGHPLPTVLRTSGRLETVGRPGTLLGLFPDPELADQHVELRPGDVMLLYTDGVTDSPGLDPGTGERRLAEVLASCADLPAEEVAARIELEVVQPRGEDRRDDVALIVLRMMDVAP